MHLFSMCDSFRNIWALPHYRMVQRASADVEWCLACTTRERLPHPCAVAVRDSWLSSWEVAVSQSALSRSDGRLCASFQLKKIPCSCCWYDLHCTLWGVRLEAYFLVLLDFDQTHVDNRRWFRFVSDICSPSLEETWACVSGIVSLLI